MNVKQAVAEVEKNTESVSALRTDRRSGVVASVNENVGLDNVGSQVESPSLAMGD